MESLNTLTLKVQKSHWKAFTEFIKTLDYVEISQVEETENESFEKGNYQIGENPADFAGLWKNNQRDLKKIREQAWTRKK